MFNILFSKEPKVAPAPSAPAQPAPAPAPTPAPVPVPVPTSTAMVIQAPVLQLITSTSNAVSPLPTALSSQTPTGTLLLKTAPGGNMMTTGQPLLIQLPLSVGNGQTGTLVNIPVSSFSAASSLNKAKTTSSTTAFIIKPASAASSAPIPAPVNTTVSALQGSSSQMSVARAVFQGGSGGICTPSAGVSVSTARTPAQPVSVAGAMSSVSSPATSGPAATGSTAPGPPQGTSLTSKTGRWLLLNWVYLFTSPTCTAGAFISVPATSGRGQTAAQLTKNCFCCLSFWSINMPYVVCDITAAITRAGGTLNAPQVKAGVCLGNHSWSRPLPAVFLNRF